MTDRDADETSRPDSAMGGASDMGTHGDHPVSSSAMKREGRSPLPDEATGDTPIERRHARDAGYRGPERRIAAAQ